jgi:hypothetical protein
MDEIALEDFCQTIQQDVNDLAGSNYPAFKRESLGLLDAVMSPANRSGYSQEYLVDGGDGKVKQILEEWIKPQPASKMATTRQNICNPTEMIEPSRQVRTLTGFVSTPVMTFTKAGLRKLCDGPAEYRAKIVASHMSGLFRKLNQGLAAKYKLQEGKFIGNVSAGKEVALIDKTNAIWQIDPNGTAAIMDDMRDLDVAGRPIMVGNGLLKRYVDLANIGCCNAYGQDNSTADEGFDFYVDRDVKAAVGGSGADDAFYAWSPGAVQMATYSENRGEFEVVHSHFAESTLVDPFTGITLDYEMRYDQCIKAWTFVFYLHYDLFLLGGDLFEEDDERYGVNYAFRYKGVAHVPES